MADFTRIGFGQVEPNQLSGIKTGQIFASLPLDTNVTTLQNGEFMYYNYALGKVTATGTAGTGSSATANAPEPYLVFNEIKIYEDWLSYKDFAMIRVGDNYVTNPAMVGRLTSANADGTTYGGGSSTQGAVPSATYNDPNSTTTPPATITQTGHTEYGYRMDGIAPRLVKTNVGDIFTTNMVETGTNIEYAVGDVLSPKATSRNTLELSKNGNGSIQFIVVKVYTMPDGQDGLKLQRIA